MPLDYTHAYKPSPFIHADIAQNRCVLLQTRQVAATLLVLLLLHHSQQKVLW
jgi:hypothetical protein